MHMHLLRRYIGIDANRLGGGAENVSELCGGGLNFFIGLRGGTKIPSTI